MTQSSIHWDYIYYFYILIFLKLFPIYANTSRYLPLLVTKQIFSLSIMQAFCTEIDTIAYYIIVDIPNTSQGKTTSNITQEK